MSTFPFSDWYVVHSMIIADHRSLLDHCIIGIPIYIYMFIYNDRILYDHNNHQDRNELYYQCIQCIHYSIYI